MARVAPLSEPAGHPFPAYEPLARLRPVALVQPGTTLPPAPCAAVERDLDGRPGEVALTSGRTRYAARYDGRRVVLTTDVNGHTRRHASRRHARSDAPSGLALTLTGPELFAWAREDGRWVARARLDLGELAGAPDPHDEAWLAGLAADGDRAGTFGQLGLRDLRVVTHADGTPYTDDGPDGRDGRVLLAATSAGPAGFRTAHTSVWSLDPAGPALEHRGDLWFRRPERPGVLGDHATHLVRDEGLWLVATSTWGDFDRVRHPRVTTTLATTTADVTRGGHVLATTALDLPAPASSVGRWDPHLVRTGDEWLVAFVSASRFFRFGPVVAQGPGLDRLALRAADEARTATEGPTLARRDGRWWVLASDGRDSARALRASYPVLDLDLRQHGTLAAAYPTNLPWPTLAGDLLVGFDATPYGGPLTGYGTHGEVVVQRALGGTGSTT